MEKENVLAIRDNAKLLGAPASPLPLGTSTSSSLKKVCHLEFGSDSSLLPCIPGQPSSGVITTKSRFDREFRNGVVHRYDVDVTGSAAT